MIIKDNETGYAFNILDRIKVPEDSTYTDLRALIGVVIGRSKDSNYANRYNIYFPYGGRVPAEISVCESTILSHGWRKATADELNATTSKSEDTETRPEHYGGEVNPFEPIKIIEYYDLGFHLGNVVKYVLRGGKKVNESIIKDLKKARWYLDREIKKLERELNEV